MKVLVACEESQRVCMSFRENGHEAYSCDIVEQSGGHPEWHIQQDVLPLLNGNCDFATNDGTQHHIDGKWDLLICHPPCTFLTCAANKYYNVDKYGDKAIKRLQDREEAKKFFMEFVNADCDRIAIENPVGIMSTCYKKPSQIIQPYQFGEKARKTTCLWLKGLSKLEPTRIVEPELNTYNGISGKSTVSVSHDVRDENGHLMSWTDPRLARERSKTFWGIARAMAEQWGKE